MFVEKGLVGLEEDDLEKLNMIRLDQVENIYVLDGVFGKSVKELSEAHDARYHQLIWKVTGDIRFSAMMSGYSNLLEDFPYLRSVFLTGVLDKDVMVTYQAQKKSFPIVDLTDLDSKGQLFRVVNLAAAEARRTYNAATSPALRIQGALLKRNELAVILTYIPVLCKDISRGKLSQYIFKNMLISEGRGDSLKSSAENLNDTIKDNNIDYWKAIVDKTTNPVNIPGIIKSNGLTSEIQSTQKMLVDDVFDLLKGFAEKYNVSMKALIINCWSAVFGMLNKEKKPTILLAGNSSEPIFYPITMDSNLGVQDRLEQIDLQIKGAQKHSYITEDEYRTVFDDEFVDKFLAQFNVVDLDDMNEEDSWMQINSEFIAPQISLNVQCYISGGKCYFNYSYKTSAYNHDVISLIHEKIVLYLNAFIDGKNITIDANEFTTKKMSADEYRKRVLMYCVKNMLATSLFKDSDQKLLARLASRCDVMKLTMDDVIVEEGEFADALYVVTYGNIEEWSIDFEGIEKTLRIISKDSILGLESLSENKVMQRYYSVASNEAVVVRIPADEMQNLLAIKPELWKKVLQNNFDRLKKIETIWMME